MEGNGTRILQEPNTVFPLGAMVQCSANSVFVMTLLRIDIIYEIHLPRIFFLKIFFDVDHFSKVFIEFVTVLLLLYVLVFWPRGMWDPSSPARDGTHTPCIGRQNLNHWTARDVPYLAT